MIHKNPRVDDVYLSLENPLDNPVQWIDLAREKERENDSLREVLTDVEERLEKIAMILTKMVYGNYKIQT